MISLSDLKQEGDTEEVLDLLLKMVSCMNNLEKAIIRGDIQIMETLSTEADDLTQKIFEAREKIIKPYPATAPTPLTEQDSKFLPPEWKEIWKQSNS